jgi:uncharacterized BrkB/YihY/UPF0761 family membrane protein
MIFSHGRLMAIIGFCVTLFLSTNGIAVVLKGLNRAYKVTETRNLIYTRALSLLMVFVDTMVMFLSINLIVFGKAIINLMVSHFHMSNGVARNLKIGVIKALLPIQPKTAVKKSIKGKIPITIIKPISAAIP